MSNEHNPKHYNAVKVNGKVLQPVDVMEAFFPKDAHLAQAVKYLLRAGRKESASYLSDVGKCLWWCARAMVFHGAKFVSLPPGTKTDSDMK